MTGRNRFLGSLMLLAALGCNSRPAPAVAPQGHQPSVDISGFDVADDEALLAIKVMGSCFD